jgi:hypothetical protein
MKILGYTPYSFSLRVIFAAMIGFIAIVVVQMYQYGAEVENAEQQLFSAWPDQAEVALYRQNCEKGPVSREERANSDRPFGKYDCARKYASIDLATAIESAHKSIPEPAAPLKYL